MSAKRCFKCERVLPLSEFYPDSRMADGHLGKCKECTRAAVQDNRAKRREQYRAYDRSRHTRERMRRITLSVNRYRSHQRARFALRNAIARGRITRQPCQVCGDPKSDAHHPDYSRPLDVEWLCRTHHRMAHRMDPDRRVAAPSPF